MENFRHATGVLIDHIHTSQLSAGERSRINLLKELLTSNFTLCKRMQIMFNITGGFFPGFEKQLAGLLTNPIFRADADITPDCIGFGREQTVFRVSDNIVKKVDRKSLGWSTDKLTDRAVELHRVHSLVNGLFSLTPAIVLAETFEVGPSHIPGLNGVLTTQRYIHHPRDFYADVTGEEGKRMVKDDPVFASQVDFFHSQFLRHFSSLEVCPDILGPKNLSVVRESNGYRLYLLDSHMMHETNQWTEVQAESKIRRINKRIAHLKGMLD